MSNERSLERAKAKLLRLNSTMLELESAIAHVRENLTDASSKLTRSVKEDVIATLHGRWERVTQQITKTKEAISAIETSIEVRHHQAQWSYEMGIRSFEWPPVQKPAWPLHEQDTQSHVKLATDAQLRDELRRRGHTVQLSYDEFEPIIPPELAGACENICRIIEGSKLPLTHEGAQLVLFKKEWRKVRPLGR